MISPSAFVGWCFAGAVLVYLLPRRSAVFSVLGLAVAAAGMVRLGETDLAWWLPPFGWEVGMDGISRTLLVVGAALVLAAGVYSWPKPPGETRAYYFWLVFFLGACAGVLSARDLLNLFVFWEVATLALFFLVRLGDERVAWYYLLVQFAGGAALFVGVMGYQALTGVLTLGPAPSVLRPLFWVGFGVKAALLGLHFWLPEVHAEAPSPVSCLLSGFAVKLGVYGLARVAPDGWSLLVWTGGFMALYGVAFALRQSDFKRLLAYHTVSQLGYVVAALGCGGEIALAAAFYYAAAHALFKGLLFLAGGAVEYGAGTRYLGDLGGLWRKMPFTATACAIGALSISGVPPLNGYAAKLAVKAATAGYPWVRLLLNVATVGTMLSFAKLYHYAFLGRARDRGAAEATEGSPAMVGAMLSLAVLCVATGARPDIVLNLGLGTGVKLALWQARHLREFSWLAGAGALAWVLGQEFLKPARKFTRDVDVLYRAFGGRLARLAVLLKAIHSGDLSVYVLWCVFLATLVGLAPRVWR